ncbi:MAG: lamin tail domain-containing protein, partial [Myxococcales bacterium]|nr:lamin tail domain-containing protein [Myxococcales bacterium]
NWCPARARYLDAPFQWGTPGGPNPPCDTTVDFCRLQFPTEAEAEFNTALEVYARVYEAGITDLTAANDGTGLFFADIGFGPDGSDPTGNLDWVWFRADPNADYNGDGPLGERNNDEYFGNLIVPRPGAWDFAARFSIDGGRSWQYCDGGDPGSSDGYQPANAGQLNAIPPAAPCDPNPCLEAPPPACEGNTAITYQAPGECGIGPDGLAECSYPGIETLCEGEEVCRNGACQPPQVRPPVVGELVITEILYDPNGVLLETEAEWIEFTNVTAEVLSLDTCELADPGVNPGQGLPMIGLLIAPGEHLLFARVADPARNGGLDVDGTFDFALTNTGDSVIIRCGGAEIDRVDYDDGRTAAGFPDARSASMSLSADRTSAIDNDQGDAWCLGDAVYFANPDEHLGTPGAPNPICPAGPVDPCAPNPCIAPPAAMCEGNTAVTYPNPGACQVANGEAVCDYPAQRQDCGAAGCLDGACQIQNARAPVAGEVVVNEIMYNPEILDESFAEWFELYNTTDEALALNGCTLSDRANNLVINTNIVILPHDYALFVRSADVARNGGLVPDGAFNFGLNNGGDAVGLTCGGVLIDRVDYGAGGFPVGVAAASIGLDPTLIDADLNDDGASWCEARSVYLADPQHLGTPGAPNDPCQPDVFDPCDPNPCQNPPVPDCLDDTTARMYAPQGACRDANGAPACDYPPIEVDCAAQGQICANGVCLDPDAVVREGDVIITEIMYDPHFALEDATAEWVEIYNRSGVDRVLDGCQLDAGVGPALVIANLALPAGGYALFASSDDPVLNGGLNPHQAFNFGLSNRGTEVRLTCNNQIIDAVTYDIGPFFPPAQAASLSLDPDARDPVDNDRGINWCLGEDVYFIDPTGNAAQNHLGTPGAANPQCPDIDVQVDYCRLVEPPGNVQANIGEFTSVAALIYEQGVTDQTPRTDFYPLLAAEAGYGPVGSDPVNNADWHWIQGFSDDAWDGSQSPDPNDRNNDRYLANVDFLGAPPGQYSLAFRFSLDQGQTWQLCDSDGSQNGFSVNNTPVVDLAGDPCNGIFCFEVPPSECDGNSVVFYGQGQCEVINGRGECVYLPNFTQDCGAQGQQCVPGEFGAFCQ